MIEDPSTAIEPRAERVIDFYGDPITVALAGEEMYVPLRSLTEFLGLEWSSQFRRVQRDEILASRVQRVSMTSADGRQREMICLPLDLLPGWLFGITASRVRVELQPKLMRYRAEAFRVLWRAFQAEAFTSASTVDLSPTTPGSSLAQIRELGLAIVNMAEQQMALEVRVGEHDGRLDRAATVIKEIERRLTRVEERTAEDAAISDAQAAEIANRVRAIAKALAEHDKSKNHYQGVFGELYRRFRVSTYKNIRQEQYGAVLAFLEEWQNGIQAT
ncbi:MAG: ORF6C domain-containing protein [Chloroflexota bacterium]|nr:ORF6C domain-containing protein [Chloroflexota bacterium]